MIKSKRNRFGLTLLGLILLVLAIALHILYSLRLSTFHFNVNRFHEHYLAAIMASSDGDFATAETHYKAALKEAEKKSPENDHIADALHALGFTYIFLKKYDDAEAAFQREVAVAEKVYGPESPEAESFRSRAKSARSLIEIRRQFGTIQQSRERSKHS